MNENDLIMLTLFEPKHLQQYGRRGVVFLSLLLFTICLYSQKESRDVREGNKLYGAKKYTEAEISYRRGIVKNQHSFEATYNLGSALFRQGKYPEALEQYKQALNLHPEAKHQEASAYHNMGNALLSNQKIEESIKAYKMALKANPTDDETRYNLAYAQAMLKKQQQDKNKNKQKNNDQKQDQPQNQQQEEQQSKNQNQKQEQKQPQMSKENAQQILDALQQDEKNTQEKAKKQQSRGVKKADKDW